MIKISRQMCGPKWSTPKNSIPKGLTYGIIVDPPKDCYWKIVIFIICTFRETKKTKKQKNKNKKTKKKKMRKNSKIKNEKKTKQQKSVTPLDCTNKKSWWILWSVGGTKVGLIANQLFKYGVDNSDRKINSMCIFLAILWSFSCS